LMQALPDEVSDGLRHVGLLNCAPVACCGHCATIVLVMLGLAVLYRFGPDRDKPQWRWVSPGAGAATILWIVGSVAFTVYVANFNSYDKTYGSLGGVVILLTWLYLSAQSERQTRKDSTEGPPRAMGQRAARAADTLG